MNDGVMIREEEGKGNNECGGGMKGKERERGLFVTTVGSVQKVETYEGQETTRPSNRPETLPSLRICQG